jgi:hypothetical protein
MRVGGLVSCARTSHERQIENSDGKQAIMTRITHATYFDFHPPSAMHNVIGLQ